MPSSEQPLDLQESGASQKMPTRMESVPPCIAHKFINANFHIKREKFLVITHCFLNSFHIGVSLYSVGFEFLKRPGTEFIFHTNCISIPCVLFRMPDRRRNNIIRDKWPRKHPNKRAQTEESAYHFRPIVEQANHTQYK